MSSNDTPTPASGRVVPLGQAPRRFGSLVRNLRRTGEITFTWYDQEAAVLVDPDEWHRLKALDTAA